MSTDCWRGDSVDGIREKVLLSDDKNYYEVLEVAKDADQDEIHRGYIQTKNAYSQDSLALYSLMTRDEQEKALELVEEAYEILSNPSKRVAYDEARGFNQEGAKASLRAKTHKGSGHTPKSGLSIKQAQDSTSQNSITKIVARERFSLNYDPDPQFEQEIEQTEDWSGEWLKKIREYKKVDIPRLSDMTRVSKTYLRALEEERFENLPPSAYIRGFVYQYAKCLKLNPDLVCSSYLCRVKRAKGE